MFGPVVERWILIATMIITPVHATADITFDYCAHSDIKIDCSPGLVILIKDAFYGDMEGQMCLEGDVGCNVTVTSLVARACDGLRHCKLAVDGIGEDSNETCFSGEAFAWITHECVSEFHCASCLTHQGDLCLEAAPSRQHNVSCWQPLFCYVKRTIQERGGHIFTWYERGCHGDDTEGCGLGYNDDVCRSVCQVQMCNAMMPASSPPSCRKWPHGYWSVVSLILAEILLMSI